MLCSVIFGSTVSCSDVARYDISSHSLLVFYLCDTYKIMSYVGAVDMLHPH